MTDLTCMIAETLAEFDGKTFSELNDQQQTPYAARAIMIAHVVRIQAERDRGAACVDGLAGLPDDLGLDRAVERSLAA